MRGLVFLIFAITLSGCSSLMMSGGSTAGSAEQEQTSASDAAISNRVKQRYAADAELSKHTIGVTTTAGLVKISGSVPSYKIRENAEKLAMTTDGVKAVDNKITVE